MLVSGTFEEVTEVVQGSEEQRKDVPECWPGFTWKTKDGIHGFADR